MAAFLRDCRGLVFSSVLGRNTACGKPTTNKPLVTEDETPACPLKKAAFRPVIPFQRSDRPFR